MAKTMIASEVMNDEMIETLVNQVRDAARKRRHELPKDAAQKALGTENLGMRMFAVFRELAEASSNLIIRLVRVNRTLAPHKALEATGRTIYCDESVVKAMPKGEGEEAEVVFFQPRKEAYRNGYISDENLAKEFEFQGLVPCDPYSLAAFNEADPAFADERPNGTHWRDKDGNWCFAAFDRWHGKRDVSVPRHGHGWSDGWWFAGLRKK